MYVLHGALLTRAYPDRDKFNVEKQLILMILARASVAKGIGYTKIETIS